ncbi:uncharacterized protein LOC131604365 [Vicia villosa]|uniref:uncharacterized protein LOC131604365 n=1 Tax=Vicia villosa TaxID=3911 RepID=UPI00273A79F4|nr:uncharacterized protein LOC131604365 [Vicia villosa]
MLGEGWKKLSYRKQVGAKWDAARSNKKDNENLSTFFFTEFDEKCKAKDVYEVFMKMGEIDEVFIPSKRDKRGRRYGFARFFNVKDERLMATKLDNMFLDGRKLFVNIPRFKRKGRTDEEGGDSAKGKRQVDLVRKQEDNNLRESRRFEMTDGRSFVEVMVV